MAIYDFSKVDKNGMKVPVIPEVHSKEADAAVEPEAPKDSQPETCRRDRFFSAVAARLFFVLLLIGDLLWICFSLIRLLVSLAGLACTGGRVPFFKTLGEKAWISSRRSMVCGVCLLLALFSPAFGVMIACTYFLMYDKSGIDEVVPSTLQSQFKEFLPKE